MEGLTEKQRICDLSSQVSNQMSSILDRDELITFFVSRMVEIFNVNRASLMLLDQTRQELFIKASYGVNPPADSSRMKLGEMFGGWVAQQGRPLLVRNIQAEFPDLLKTRLRNYQSKSFVIIPIKVSSITNMVSKRGEKEVIGILSLTDRKDLKIFTDEDLRIINSLCHCLSCHIENIRLLEKNADLLVIDVLTGLSNHRYFQEQLIEEIYRAERYRHPFSLLMLDVDNFCSYNQTYGYNAGDSALKQIAGIIRENTRRIDLVARYGPEEFMVLLPDTRLKQALFVGEKIKEIVGCSVFTEDRTSSSGIARLTVSIGVVQHKIGLSKEELLRRVVSALLEAKLKGKNRVCVFK